MPLANTNVFHPNWSTHHQPTAAGQMLADCLITRPAGAGATFNEATAVTSIDEPALVYEGPCREQALTTAGGTVGSTVGGGPDRDITIRSWRICIDTRIAGAEDVAVNDLVEITASPDDPSRVGVRLQVAGVAGGTMHWQRDLYCTDLTPTAR